MKIWQQFQGLSKAKRRLAYAIFSLFVYALVGFFLMPAIVQPLIIDTLTEKLDRKTTLKSVQINPFFLSLTLHELSVEGKHATQLIGFEKLVINFQPTSLFKQVVAFDEISVFRPDIKVIKLASGQFNYDDLIKPLVQDENVDKETKSTNDESWPLAIDKFRYVEGGVYFEDRNRLTEFKSQIASISISLDNFSTRPGDGNLHHIKAQTLRGTTVDWEGEFSLSPIKSNGHFELLGDLMVVSDYMQDQMHIKINRGKLDVKTDYQFELSDKASVFIVNNMLAAVTDLDVRRKDNNEVLGWKRFNVDMAKLDLFNKKAVINKVSTTGVYANITKNKNSQIDFGDLFVLQNMVEDSQGKQIESGTDNVESSDSQWDISIERIISVKSDVVIVDESVTPFAQHELMFDLFDISHLKPFSDDAAEFLLSLKINNSGFLEIKGNAQPVSRIIDFNLHADSVELKNYQPYLNELIRADILNGQFGADLTVKVDASKINPALVVNGDVSVSSLSMRDKKLKEKFLSWKLLAINALSFEYPQQVINVKKVNVNQPYLRLVMNGGAQTNIQKLLVEADPKKDDSTDKKLKAKKNGLRVQVKNISINDAKMDFSDNSLKPNFNAGIYQLKGNVRGLSSKQLSKAQVDLKGKVDRYAPVTIKGDINPLTRDKYSEIEMRFKGIELTTFTPYSGKFAGYKIEKGKLSLDLSYKLSKSELVAENRVILDQLTLGEETDSKDATSLPVNFALSLLKDSNGVIDFNLPIRGNIDDPDFQYGSLIWGALGNLIVGIVSSPFKALANLAGSDGEGLDYVVFKANSAQLSDSEKSKLDSLAKALLQRPQLHLEIRGVASSLVDHDEMAYFKVRKKLQLKPQPLALDVDPDDMDEIVDYYETITRLSADKLLPKKHNLTSVQENKVIFDKALIVVLNKTQITQAEYLKIAELRAEKIQQYLIEKGKVSSENIFLLDSSARLESEFEDVKNAQLKLPLSLKAK